MIITCPHCQTKYQVTYEAIGSAGRKVQCAHCQQAWQQHALSPKDEPKPEERAAFEAIAEDAMDDAMETEARKVAKAAKRLSDDEAKREKDGAGKIDPAVVRMRQRAFSRREHSVSESMPMARLRRAARYLLALALMGSLATGYFARFQVVERFPAMAGVYNSLGLGVNVVGLDFSNVTTMKTLRDGKEVLVVSAQIVGLRPNPVRVPPVVVTLFDSHGEGIYQWSVTPSVRDLMQSERATFDTQLALPPGEADHVQLSFAGGAALRPGESLPVTAPAANNHGASAAQTPNVDHGTEHDTGSATPSAHGDDADHGAAAPAHPPAPEHH